MGKMRGGGARNDFERADFRQARKDLVLDAFGEERVLLIAAAIFKRQDRDRLSRQGRRAAVVIFPVKMDGLPRRRDLYEQSTSCVAPEEKQTGQEDRADDDHIDPGLAA